MVVAVVGLGGEQGGRRDAEQAEWDAQRVGSSWRLHMETGVAIGRRQCAHAGRGGKGMIGVPFAIVEAVGGRRGRAVGTSSNPER